MEYPVRLLRPKTTLPKGTAMTASPRLRLERLEDRLTLDGSAVAPIVITPTLMPTVTTMVYTTYTAPMTTPAPTSSPPPLVLNSGISISDQLAAQQAYVAQNTINMTPQYYPGGTGDIGIGTGYGGGASSS